LIDGQQLCAKALRSPLLGKGGWRFGSVMQDERKTDTFLFADSYEQHGQPRPDRQSIARSATDLRSLWCRHAGVTSECKNAAGPEWMWTGRLCQG